MEIKKINRDVHGYYIRMGGCIYRPQQSTEAYPHDRTTVRGWTSFVPYTGQVVKASVMSRTPLLKVHHGQFEFDVWYSHGLGFDPDAKKYTPVPSEKVWCPLPEKKA